MKECFITASVSRSAGGLQQGIRGLARSSVSPEQAIHVLGTRDQHTDADIASWKPVPVDVFQVFGPERFSFAPGLARKLKELDPEILQLHGLWRYPSIVTTRWHRRTGRPYIVHPHGMLDSWAVRNAHWKKTLASLFYERGMLRNAACIRALCKSEAESIRKYGCSNPICIIPNGMDLSEVKNGKLEIGNPPWAGLVEPGRNILLYLGRIHPKKGLANLLRAWSQTQGGGSKKQWVLALAGWDEAGHEQELKQLATELGLAWTDIRSRLPTPNSQLPTSCSVLFLGPQFSDAKTACYANCDAFILPSFSEGLPMVILEAWSHGKPAVMTPECNLPEGFSADAGVRISADLEGISDGLDRLFAMSAAELNKMGQNGLRLTAQKFNWKTIALQLHSVCNWVVKGGARPDCVSAD
jgi:poly(glycerol-phosphate) alpha-glucosyltransferase